jgi:hypothetical protein
MKPGANFAWISCTTFETSTGEMKGHFIFTNLRTGKTHVVIPFYTDSFFRILISRKLTCWRFYPGERFTNIPYILRIFLRKFGLR